MMNEVSLKKGSFIGQEVIARLDTYDKVQKFLVQFELKEDYTGELPIGLFDSEKGETGILTSVSTIRNDGKILGLGLVRKNILEKGRILRMGSQNSESFLSIKELK
jgi:folate-binding Fe-S cluster repair protein YgfZ